MVGITIAALVGIIVGGGTVFGIMHKKSNTQPTIDTTAVGQAEAVTSLSNLDIVQSVCTPDYIKERGDGLCREMYCLAQANSTTGAANEKTCDAVSNVNNSLVIINTCLKLDGQARLDCLTVFRERK